MFGFLKGVASGILPSLGKVATGLVGQVADVGKNLVTSIMPNVLSGFGERLLSSV